MRSMFIVKSKQLLHYNYISEKLGCSIADGVCLAEIIGEVVGRPYVTCEEIRKEIAGNKPAPDAEEPLKRGATERSANQD